MEAKNPTRVYLLIAMVCIMAIAGLAIQLAEKPRTSKTTKDRITQLEENQQQILTRLEGGR